jgi:hypothetical protein
MFIANILPAGFLVTESCYAPACQQVQHMSRFIPSFDDPITVSRKTRARKDTSEACRERASEDLLKSVTMFTANERLILERSAASWGVRAEMLEGIERSAAQRRASVSRPTRKDEDHVRL